uniref:Uncharacterized protein n=2 Tax=Physcomitrium patens TaxID=3218 RepID=A0A2K1IYV2_PHYPA|nr:hypothetical protein PHYPA_024272 [Physcomitrium patens]
MVVAELLMCKAAEVQFDTSYYLHTAPVLGTKKYSCSLVFFLLFPTSVKGGSGGWQWHFLRCGLGVTVKSWQPRGVATRSHCGGGGGCSRHLIIYLFYMRVSHFVVEARQFKKFAVGSLSSRLC